MQTVIVNESKHSVPRKFINLWLAEMSLELKKRRILSNKKGHCEITLVFLNKRSAQKINKEFRGKDYATDVLSFGSMDSESLGELILCPEVLKRQAQEHGLSYQKELGYMLLHGVLHLLGYDHETSEKDAEHMFRIQDAVFERLIKSIS